MQPKYWCKHCKTFVRDTKLEKQNHDATPKHQGNLQRFLRELHRGNEREDREKQRAKDEVARLNGVLEGAAGLGVISSGRKPSVPAPTDKRQASPADRKRQLQQLADMGVAVPEEARRHMAMAGDWQIQSVTPIYEKIAAAQEEEDSKKYNPSALAVGVRKRQFEGDEEKEEAGEKVVRKGWGSTIRTWQNNDDGELDNLLKVTKTIKPEPNDCLDTSLSDGSLSTKPAGEQLSAKQSGSFVEQPIKREESEDAAASAEESEHRLASKDVTMKSEDDAVQSDVMFKKRKPRPNRRRGRETS